MNAKNDYQNIYQNIINLAAASGQYHYDEMSDHMRENIAVLWVRKEHESGEASEVMHYLSDAMFGAVNPDDTIANFLDLPDMFVKDLVKSLPFSLDIGPIQCDLDAAREILIDDDRYHGRRMPLSDLEVEYRLDCIDRAKSAGGVV